MKNKIRKKLSPFKKILILIAIFVLGITNILIYLNNHLYYRAEKIEDNVKKIKIHEGANKLYPFNDLIFYELGKSYFDLAIKNLNDKKLLETYLQKSIENYTRSLKINPASFFCHFYFAQSLLYMSYIGPATETEYYDEYKKAALLAGHNSQVYHEVAKIFLSRWPELSEEDRAFTLNILRKITEKKDREILRNLMQIWDLNVQDYTVMEKILPEDAAIYRLYARFLGEKSLSLEKRKEILARAEFLEFERAKSCYYSGKRELPYFRFKEALKHFESCADILERLNFYQSLTQKTLIDYSDFIELKKSVLLEMAKCRVEEGQGLKEVEEDLCLYLSLENEVAATGELESYLRERGLIEKELGAGFDDLNRLSFHILLSFKQNRYRDIMRIGRLLGESFVVVPEAGKGNFVEILQLVGDSYQKIDYIYDALEFYYKALEIDPDSLETLLRIRKNYERLNEEEKIRELDKKIERLLMPEETLPENSFIFMGQNFLQTLILDGREIVLDLHFEREGEGGYPPLISILFNGRVVWEDYLKNKEKEREGETGADNVISLSLKSRVGKNTLVVTPLNKSVIISEIFCRRDR